MDKEGERWGRYTEWDRRVGVVDLPWSSIPPMRSILPCHPPHPGSSTPPILFMLPCHLPHLDSCMLSCSPPHPDHHGQCSPGCPWHPCSICVARTGRLCRPTLHNGHAVGVVFCGSAKMSAPPQESARAHQVCGRLSWQRPMKVSARRGQRCTHWPWTSSPFGLSSAAAASYTFRRPRTN